MKITTVVLPWPDINLHYISSITTLCPICLSNMHPDQGRRRVFKSGPAEEDIESVPKAREGGEHEIGD